VISIIIFVLLVDQVVKIWIKQNFAITETKPLIPGFIQLYFIENRGMAFGTTLGDGIWPKYILSLFRFVAIIGIGLYIRKLILENEAKYFFLVTIALIFAGAAGNLIDGMLYDGCFGIDASISENWMTNEFGMPIYGPDGEIQLREGGFLLGSVVDMFQFTFRWPVWMPFDLGGKEAFPFIFNVADAAISLGVVMLVLRYREFSSKSNELPKEKDEDIVVS